MIFASAILPARAQLTAWSPFGSVPAAADAPKPEQTLEFSGFLSGPAGTQYVVTDKARKAHAWLNLNQRDATLGLLARRYDAQNEILVVEQAGSVKELPLRRGKIASSGALPPPPAPRPLPVAVVSPLPAAPATAVHTIERLQAEIARNRAAREQQAAGQSAPRAPAGK